MKDPRQLTPAEFEIIQILWRDASARSVADVLKVLRQKKSVAYTTVMTLLDKMARKGSVQRRKQGKAYFYSPCVERAEVVDFLIRNFTLSYSLEWAHRTKEREERPEIQPTPNEDVDVTLL